MGRQDVKPLPFQIVVNATTMHFLSFRGVTRFANSMLLKKNGDHKRNTWKNMDAVSLPYCPISLSASLIVNAPQPQECQTILFRYLSLTFHTPVSSVRRTFACTRLQQNNAVHKEHFLSTPPTQQTNQRLSQLTLIENPQQIKMQELKGLNN